MDRYAVIGHPVEHSRSPLIHQAFARQSGQTLEYGRVLAPLDDFAGTVARLREAGYHGCNVTVPFKLEAFHLAERLTARAQAAQAVNTLRFDPAGIHGDNTDGAGLVQDLRHNLKVVIAQQRVLLLGAGGAAQGVLHPLLAEAPQRLVIANRSLERAEALRQQSGAHNVQTATFAALQGETFDLVINATSAGLHGEHLPLPTGLFAPEAMAYDLMYGQETPFMAFARSQGARVADGLGMLVEQAAESFLFWRGVRPETAAIIARLRA